MGAWRTTLKAEQNYWEKTALSEGRRWRKAGPAPGRGWGEGEAAGLCKEAGGGSAKERWPGTAEGLPEAPGALWSYSAVSTHSVRKHLLKKPGAGGEKMLEGGGLGGACCGRA